MLDCENCIYEEYKNKLFCCLANQLAEARTNLLKQIPFVGKHVKEHECVWYQPNGGVSK